MTTSSPPLRVLCVSTDALIGGAERFLVSMAQAWPDADTIELVVLMEPGSLSSQLEAAFDEVHYLNFPPTSRNLFGMVSALTRLIRETDADVVWSHMFHADLVTALARRPKVRVSTQHTQALSGRDHPLTRLIARGVGLLSSGFDAIVPVSDSPAMGEFMASLRMRHLARPIANGAAVGQNVFDPESRTFLSLARSHPVKGHGILFQAFAQVMDEAPEWTLRAFGPGVEERDPVMQSAIRHDLVARAVAESKIKLEGSTTAPARALAEASALVISSTYGEAFPIVGAEAAGSGIPVITTDVGSCAEFADDPQFLVPPGDVDKMSQALLAWTRLTDGERTELSRVAHARAVAKYSPSIAATRYRQLFMDLVGAKGR